jgi:hypothetical protein
MSLNEQTANNARQPTPGVHLVAYWALLVRRGCAERYA